MPRPPRRVERDIVYHVINRANGKQRIFRKDEDFAAFLKVLGEALSRWPVDLFAYCIMSNHWHLLVRPRTDAALSKFMGWLTVTHARRLHQHYKSPGSGHVYQGRFKSFPVEQDEHFLTVARYVEANARRAGIVEDALAWPWGSAAQRQQRGDVVALAQWPVDRPRGWAGLLNETIGAAPLADIHTSISRGRPYGSPTWTERLAERLGLQSSLKPRGQPPKAAEDLSARQLRRRHLRISGQ